MDFELITKRDEVDLEVMDSDLEILWKSVNQSKNNRENMHKVLKVREKVTDIFF